jgi:hypothetical protein
VTAISHLQGNVFSVEESAGRQTDEPESEAVVRLSSVVDAWGRRSLLCCKSLRRNAELCRSLRPVRA